jgi:hypothetical protein
MPTTSDRSTIHPRTLAIVVAALLTVGALLAAPAMAATEEQQGAQLLQRVQAGTVSCSSLGTSDFDRIGEYAMGRMLGSSAAHEAMDRRMTAVMGARGETQAHVFMGQRFAGCASGRAPATFGAMMGMMGSGYRAGGGMMSFGSAASTADGSGWNGTDTVMAVMMGVLLALVAGALVAWRPWRRSPDTRLADGSISVDEYEQRRAAPEGRSTGDPSPST